MSLPDAEDLRYWRTSDQSTAEDWMERTVDLIGKFGGETLAQAQGSVNGNAGFMIRFRIDDNTFQVQWPVCPSRLGDDRAAKIQAATMLHHDVKARIMAATVFGTRHAFFQFLQLPDGRTMVELSAAEIEAKMPKLLPEKGGGRDD